MKRAACPQRMQEAEADAARNANLVHAITYQEAIAGIFKPPPSEHRADFMGLFLNCVVAGEALTLALACRLQGSCRASSGCIRHSLASSFRTHQAGICICTSGTEVSRFPPDIVIQSVGSAICDGCWDRTPVQDKPDVLHPVRARLVMHDRGCVAGLYMCQYMLIIPTLTDVLRRIGVSTGLVGAIAGASDFASMFMTPGACPLPNLPQPLFRSPLSLSSQHAQVMDEEGVM